MRKLIHARECGDDFFQNSTRRIQLLRSLLNAGADTVFIKFLLNSESEFTDLPANVLRMIARVSRTEFGERMNGFFEDVGLILDWVRAEKPIIDKHRERAGWAWLMRKQTEWHLRGDLAKARLRTLSWESLLAEFVDGKYRVVPLQNQSGAC